MADAQTTFAELRSLISRLPGVSVESADISPNGFSITLCIVQPDSVGQLAHCAAGANIPVEVWSAAPQGRVEERSNPKHLRYFLRSLGAHGGMEKALDRFSMFGNFLVWHLHAMGSIPTAEANRLLTLWNGRHVAA
jgi:hypothetical protein